MKYDELKTAPRELISRFAIEMANAFVLSETAAEMKEMFPRLQALNTDERCWDCRSPEIGHFFEECVARTTGRIDQLYRPATP